MPAPPQTTAEPALRGSAEKQPGGAPKPRSREPEPPSKLLLFAVFTGLLVPFLIVARYRLVDGDEGFYLMASRLVFGKHVPYRDFFFTQMPLLPYLFGLFLAFVGNTWVAARAFSAILASLAGVAVFRYVCLETRQRAAGVVAVLLFAASTLVLGWFTIAKTYALSALLLLLAFQLMRARSSSMGVALSGMWLGLAVDVRLYLAAVLPLFVWWIYRDSKQQARLRAIAYFLAGFGIVVLPNVYFLVLDPAAYIFDNLLFHSIRSDGGLIGNYPQKLLVIAQLFFGRGPGNGLQMTLLSAFVFWMVIYRRSTGSASRRAFQLAAVLALISLLPTPSYVQYFSLCVPFLIIAAVCSASDALQSMESLRYRRLAAAGAVAIALLYAASSAGNLARFTRTGDGLNGIRNQGRAPNWNVDTVRAVSRAIDELAAPGEVVMSLWPGYIFESGTVPFPGLENNTGRERVDVLDPEVALRNHILSEDRVKRAIASHASRIVVVGNQESMFIEAAPYREALTRSGYSLVKTIGDASIWLAPR